MERMELLKIRKININHFITIIEENYEKLQKQQNKTEYEEFLDQNLKTEILSDSKPILNNKIIDNNLKEDDKKLENCHYLS